MNTSPPWHSTPVMPISGFFARDCCRIDSVISAVTVEAARLA